MATILVVDDRPLNREFLVTLLGYAGHRVLEASDGIEALKIIQNEHPNLVITDILMPTMDGYELVNRLRADPALRDIPVIFYTATYRTREAYAMAEACGIAAVLSKPSEPEQILNTVQTVLGLSPKVPPGSIPLKVSESKPSNRIVELLIGYLGNVEIANQLMAKLLDRQDQTRETLPTALRQLSLAIDHMHSLTLRLATLIEVGIDLSIQREPKDLLETFCRAAQDICMARYAAVGIHDNDRQVLRYFYTRGYDDDRQAWMDGITPNSGTLGQLLIDRAPQRLAGKAIDPETLGLPSTHPPVHSFMVLPIASPTKIYGWFYLAEKMGADEFNEADMDIAMMIAAQVAIAYENLVLNKELRQRSAELQIEVTERKQAQDSLQRTLRARVLMSEANRLLAHANDEQELLQSICELIVTQGGYTLAWIGWRENDKDKSAKTVAWAGDRDHLHFMLPHNAQHGNTPADIAIRTGQPFIINDLQHNAAFLPSKNKAMQHGPCSAISLPIKSQDSLLGALTIIACEPNAFINDEVALLEELAGDIAYGIHNLRATTALRISESRFAGILDLAHDAIISIDAAQRIVLFNQGAERIYGYASEEAKGQPLAMLLPEDVRRRYSELIERFRASGNDSRTMGDYLEVFGLRKNGQIFPAETALSKLKTDAGIILTAIVRDISERKRNEQALKDREAHFHAVAQSANDAFISGDAEGNIVFWNAGAQRLFGYNEQEILGRPLTLLIPERFREAHRQGMQRFLASGEKHIIGNSVELFAVNNDGSEFPIELSLADWKYQGQTFFTAIVRDITERKRYEMRIEHLASHDALTGLPNRNLLHDRFNQSLAHIRRSERLMAVLFLDLDRFKDLNDSYGHDAGDALLQTVAERLCASVRHGDTVARQGGDEFIILLSDLSSIDDVYLITSKLIQELSRLYSIQGHEFFLGGSIGGSICPNDAEDLPTLLQYADAAMYQAKTQGGNTFRLYTPDMSKHVIERIELERALRRAIENGEFELYYQPKIELKTFTIVGAEALIRWHHPQLGLISPARFIPLAESTGLIVPLGQWVLHTACVQNKAWQNVGLPPIIVAVNLSTAQLHDEGLLASITRTLSDSGLEARYLELELTESMVMDNPRQAVPILDSLKALGLSLSLDDFGTGYSSLSYLKRFPFDRLKIDQSFVRDIPFDTNDAIIARSVISLGASLGLKVTAEGVETEDQADFLQQNDCDEFQGFYCSKPLPVNEFFGVLQKGCKSGCSNVSFKSRMIS